MQIQNSDTESDLIYYENFLKDFPEIEKKYPKATEIIKTRISALKQQRQDLFGVTV